MDMKEMEKQIQLWKDKEDIKNVQIMYGRYADRRDWDSYAKLFCDPISVDYGDFDPTAVLNNVPVSDYMAMVRKNMGHLRTHHQFTNFLIEVDGDTAKCSSMMVGFHVLDDVPVSGDNWQETGGRYDLDLVRTPDGWKIKKFSSNFIYFRGNYNVFAK